MRIEHMFTDDCPNAAETDALVRDAVLDLAPDAEIVSVRVESEDEARRLGFHGSPSVRVDGEDLEGRREGPFSIACRVYDHGDGMFRGVPPRWLVEAAVLRALRPRGVLFLCVANSARSQMAEGIARSLAPEGVRVSSAGSVPSIVRPEAIRALGEIGIDISAHRSKGLDSIDPSTVDAVITLCAEEVCPVFLGKAVRLHWGMQDPAMAGGSEEEKMAAFRGIRDELRRRLEILFRGWNG